MNLSISAPRRLYDAEPVVAPRYAAKRLSVLPNMEAANRLEAACSLASLASFTCFIQY